MTKCWSGQWVWRKLWLFGHRVLISRCTLMACNATEYSIFIILICRQSRWEMIMIDSRRLDLSIQTLMSHGNTTGPYSLCWLWKKKQQKRILLVEQIVFRCCFPQFSLKIFFFPFLRLKTNERTLAPNKY